MNYVWCIDKNYYPSCWAAFNSRFLSRTKVFTYNKKMYRKGQNNIDVLGSKERIRKSKKIPCAYQLLDSKEGVLKGNDLFGGCLAICLELGLDRVHLLADLVSLLLNLLFYLVELPEQESLSPTWSSPKLSSATWSSPIWSSTTRSSWLWSSCFSPLQSSLLYCQTGWAGILILC